MFFLSCYYLEPLLCVVNISITITGGYKMFESFEQQEPVIFSDSNKKVILFSELF